MTKGRSWAKLGQLAPAIGVGGSQLSLAGAGYLTLVLAGRTLGAADFAAITSFYLLLNVVGRGLCSASELELTRSVAHARLRATGAGGVCRAGARHTAVLLGLALVALAAAVPLLNRVFVADPLLTALLALSLPGMAGAHVLRGPLAGSRRYQPYAATYLVEATVVVGFGVVLLGVGETNVLWWAVGLALGPLVATAVVGWPLRHVVQRVLSSGGPADSDPRDLVAAVGILAGVQAVWNLPPVLLAAAATDRPAVAAGFAAVALVLRIPALLFPAMQALVLPILGAREPISARAGLRVGVLVGAGAVGVVWMVGATALTPLAVRLTFGPLELPGVEVRATLAAAALVGTAAQLAQTKLVADRRQVWAALVCALAVLSLVLTTLLPGVGPTSAALGLLVALSVLLAGSITVLVLGQRGRPPSPFGVR